MGGTSVYFNLIPNEACKRQNGKAINESSQYFCTAWNSENTKSKKKERLRCTAEEQYFELYGPEELLVNKKTAATIPNSKT